MLLRKIQTLFLASLALMVAVAVRALRPLVLVRIGPLSSNVFAGFAAQTELYLCEREAGLLGPSATDILYYDARGISNFQLKKMWERILRIHSCSSLLDQVRVRLPQQHLIPQRSGDADMDIHGLLPHTEPHISFTEEEEERGQAALLGMGIPQGTGFVCFHNRDQAYTASSEPEHNWDDSSYRFCSVENFLPAAEELANRGYFALRMGSVVGGPLAITSPRVIDYATVARTDFLDIYLSAKCRFCIGCTSGFFAGPQIFRRPLVLTNYWAIRDIPFHHPDTLMIPKKLWLRKDRRFLSFREILDHGIGKFRHTRQFEQFGLDLIENTAEEISAVAIEMDDRLSGTWNASQEDEELQGRFRSLFEPRESDQVPLSRMGAEYLRNNRDLLV